MSNYCACSGGDEEYTIELNQQGPEGPQGPVGPEGFSPSISVKTNTDKAYILTVVNKEGNFDTPNLYGELEKLNADLSNIPNPAVINGVSLSSIEDNISMITMDSSRITTSVDGNLILNATASNEGSMEVFNYEVVANPKEQRLELHDNEGNVKIVATTDYIPTIGVATTTTAGIVKPDGSTITVGPDGTISAVQQDLSNFATKEELTTLDTTLSADIAALDADKLASSNIIAGANITIDRDGNNLTINSTGGGAGGSSIDDGSISSVSTWSSSKINSEITTVANTKNDNIFDIGKFKVIGNPAITDDGIASGFSLSNYITKTTTLNLTKPFEIKFKINHKSDNSKQQAFISFNDIEWLNYILDDKTQLTVYCKFADNTDYNLVCAGLTTDEQTYYICFSWNGSTYTLKYSTDNLNWVESKYNSSVPLMGYDNINTICIGKLLTNNYYPLTTGQIDLKNFLITVDGNVVINSLMESTKPIYDKITTTSTELSTFEVETDNNFSAVNSALNEKANLSDLAGYVTVNKYNELLARVVALETEINGGNA